MIGVRDPNLGCNFEPEYISYISLLYAKTDRLLDQFDRPLFPLGPQPSFFGPSSQARAVYVL